ncbi:MAG: response regulator transcription factor, partial [Dactylosporangium sp.]|nr:response regulator transcription factor [Dactylosporangium sp.]
FIGPATVKTHLGRVLMKLGVRDRVQAVVVAYKTGLVKPDVQATADASVRTRSDAWSR